MTHTQYIVTEYEMQTDGVTSQEGPDVWKTSIGIFTEESLPSYIERKIIEYSEEGGEEATLEQAKRLAPEIIKAKSMIWEDIRDLGSYTFLTINKCNTNKVMLLNGKRSLLDFDAKSLKKLLKSL